MCACSWDIYIYIYIYMIAMKRSYLLTIMKIKTLKLKR